MSALARSAQFAKNLQRFRLVTFDVTDTLLRFREPPSVSYARIAAREGVKDIDQDKIKHCFRQEFRAMMKMYPNFGCTTPEMSWQEWWIALVGNVFRCVDSKISSNQLTTITTALMKYYDTKDCWTHEEGALALVKRMRHAGKYVGVISNFDPRLHFVLQTMGLGHEFDFVVCSYDICAQKPDPRIFQHALTQADVHAAEALHIGNLYELDYIGARNAGWSSLLLSGGGKEEVPREHRKHVFSNIGDMQKALDTTEIEWQ